MEQQTNLIVILTKRLRFIKKKDELTFKFISELKNLKNLLKEYAKICTNYETARDAKYPNKYQHTDIDEILGNIKIIDKSINMVKLNKKEIEFQQKVKYIRKLFKYCKHLEKIGKSVDLTEPFEEFSDITKNLEKSEEIEKSILDDLSKSIMQTELAISIYTNLIDKIKLALKGKITFEQVEDYDAQFTKISNN